MHRLEFFLCIWLGFVALVLLLTGSIDVALEQLVPALLPTLLFAAAFYGSRFLVAGFWTRVAIANVSFFAVLLLMTTLPGNKNTTFNAWRNGVPTVIDGVTTACGYFSLLIDAGKMTIGSGLGAVMFVALNRALRRAQ